MIKPIEVKIVQGNKIFVCYSNGVEGELDIKHLSAQDEFNFITDATELGKVYINPISNDLCWPNGASLCKNAIYRQLELKALLKRLKIDLDKI